MRKSGKRIVKNRGVNLIATAQRTARFNLVPRFFPLPIEREEIALERGCARPIKYGMVMRQGYFGSLALPNI